MNLLSEWFGDSASGESAICIFTTPSEKTRRFSDPIKASEYAATVNGDCYFGVGLMRPVTKGRGKADDCVGIGGLWCDLDWRSTKQGKPLANSESVLLDFIRRTIPIQPSVIVKSGGGFHLYWIFKEPWIFADEAERQKAAKLAHDWHGWINRQAPAWQLENCGDLSRILRIPGTWNRKYGEPILCEIYESNDRRFVPDDFDDYVEIESHKPAKLTSKMEARSAADQKFLQLYRDGTDFKKSFDHERTDLLDYSPSGYDLSLVTIAAANGWTDGELCWLIEKHRNYWGDKPEKAYRQDYLARTIGKARESRTIVVPSGEVDLTELLASAQDARDRDPGKLDLQKMRVPGFISELMDYTLATAPYQNNTLAFTGALAMQSLLCARKVSDTADMRPNIYVLSLAQSGSGKDWPRKVNVNLANACGIGDKISDRFASGEGIEDTILASLSVLFQTDEIDGLLQSMNKARDARYETMMQTLLTLYSSSNSSITERARSVKNGKALPPRKAHNPSMSILGTAIPQHYYDALSDRMLTNGLFARLLVFDAGNRGRGGTPHVCPIPQSLIEQARAWIDYSPGGNLASVYPEPMRIPFTPEALTILDCNRIISEDEYAIHEQREDKAGTSIWARACENAQKLAILYACSQYGPTDKLVIDADAMQWGIDVSFHQVRTTLYAVSTHRAETEFATKQNRLLAVLREWDRLNHGGWMPYRSIGRKLRWRPREHEELRQSLEDAGLIETRKVLRSGRSRVDYRILTSRPNVQNPNVQPETDWSEEDE